MTASAALLLDWEPDQLRAGAARLAELADGTWDAQARLGSCVEAELTEARWRGPGGAAALQAVQHRRLVLARLSADLSPLAHRLLAAGLRLVAGRAHLRAAVDAVAAQPSLRLATDGSVSVDKRVLGGRALLTGLVPLLAPVEAVGLAGLAGKADRLEAEVASAVQDLHATDVQAAADMDRFVADVRATLRVDEPAILGEELAARVATGGGSFARWLRRVPAGGRDPQDVADWWAVQSTAGRRALLASAGSAHRLADLDGIPLAVRDAINRGALAQHLRACSRVGRRLGGGAVAQGSLAACRVDRAVARTLASVGAHLDPATGRRVLLQLLVDDSDAWGGRGRVVVSVGRADLADHVAYLVPGLGQQPATGLADLVGKATSLYDQAREDSPGSTVAVVAWLGYRAPGVTDVAFLGRARAGAGALAQALRGLRAARDLEQPHLTVVGHSYGSTTASAALARTAGVVDDFVALGSPGLLVDRAGLLPVPAGHVWVGAGSADEVSRLSRFGQDPAAAAFGARRFAAEPPPGTSLLGQHTSYLDPGTAALGNVAHLVVRQDAQVRLVPGRTDDGFAGLLAVLPVLLVPGGPVPPWPLPPAPPWPFDPTFGDPAEGLR